jgi:GAF domain-containing protein
MRWKARGDGRSRRAKARRSAASAPETLQYTVRAIPAHVDRALRRKAAAANKSLNTILRDALIREADMAEPSGRLHTDLDELAGTWRDDPAFDEAIQAQDRVDPSLWR